MALGRGAEGVVTVNLCVTPHLLIAGTTGSGKTMLVKNIILQCREKGAQVYIIDGKGGIDYGQQYRSNCCLLTNRDEIATGLADIQDIMEERRIILGGTGYHNIQDYNAHNVPALPRIAIVVDETSILLDPSGCDKEEKEQIAKLLKALTDIGRIGRAYGVHLICCTQRPSVESVPGKLKAVLDGRICGHT